MKKAKMIRIRLIMMVCALVIAMPAITGCSSKKIETELPAASMETPKNSGTSIAHPPLKAEATPTPAVNPGSAPNGKFVVLKEARRSDIGIYTYNYKNDTVNIMHNGNEFLSISINDNGDRTVTRKDQYGRIGIGYVYDKDGKLIKDIWPFNKYHLYGYYMCEYDESGKISEIQLYIQGGDNEYHLIATTKYTYIGDKCLKEQVLEELTDLSYYSYDVDKYYVDEYGLLCGLHHNDNKYGDSICCDGDIYFDVDLNQIRKMFYYLAECNINIEETLIYNEFGEEIELTEIYEAYDGNIYIDKTFFGEGYPSTYGDDMILDKNGNILPCYIYGRGDGRSFACKYFTEEHEINADCKPIYDSNGRITKCTHTYSKYSWSICEFNEKGQKVKEYAYLFAMFDSNDYVTANYNYASSGKLESVQVSSSSGGQRKEYIFDSAGRVCTYKKNEYSGFSGAEEAVLYMEFDNKGNAYMKKYEFNCAGKKLRCVEYLYDENYILTGRIYSFYDDKGNTYYMETYDAEGRKILEEYYDLDGSQRRRKFIYNERGWLVSINEHDGKGILQQCTEYIRSAAGTVLDIKTLLSGNETQEPEYTEYEYTYTYDENNNLTSVTKKSADGYMYVFYCDLNGNINSIECQTRLGFEKYEFEEATEAEYALYSKFDIEELINKYL